MSQNEQVLVDRLPEGKLRDTTIRSFSSSARRSSSSSASIFMKKAAETMDSASRGVEFHRALWNSWA